MENNWGQLLPSWEIYSKKIIDKSCFCWNLLEDQIAKRAIFKFLILRVFFFVLKEDEIPDHPISDYPFSTDSLLPKVTLTNSSSLTKSSIRSLIIFNPFTTLLIAYFYHRFDFDPHKIRKRLNFRRFSKGTKLRGIKGIKMACGSLFKDEIKLILFRLKTWVVSLTNSKLNAALNVKPRLVENITRFFSTPRQVHKR